MGAFPWVRAASVSTLSPLSGRDRGVLMAVSGEPTAPGVDRGIHVNTVSAGYFKALQRDAAVGKDVYARGPGQLSEGGDPE